MVYGYVYMTTNNINDKKYIGLKKSNIFLRNYFGSGKLIQKVLKKYGRDNFSVEILKWCHSETELIETELYYINLYNAHLCENFYNMINTKTPILGHIFKKHSEKTKKLLSELAKNRPPMTKETKSKISKTSKERWSDINYRNKIKRKIMTEEECINLSNKMKEIMKDKGPLPEETKRKISLSRTGKKYGPHSEEHKRKISESNKGKKKENKHNKNPEKIRKTVEKHKGMKRSDEARKNMSESCKGRKSAIKGKKIYHNPKTKENKYFFEGSQDDGFVLGIYRKGD